MAETGTRRADDLQSRADRSKPVDLVHLGRFTLGDRALEHEVLELFAGQAPVYLERLRQAASEQDWREAAHSMKGSAAAVGAWRVAHLSACAEALTSVPDAARRLQAIEQVAAAVAEASDYIGGLFRAA